MIIGVLALDTSNELSEALILAEARLGDRAALDHESEALLREEARDHWQLPQSQVLVANAYAILHDADRAVAPLAAALASPSDITPTPALLRIDPVWDTFARSAFSKALLRRQAVKKT